MENLSKSKVFRSKKYTDWIKSQRCRVLMTEGPDCHHVINILPGAMGSKVSDLFTIPLSRSIHANLHHIGKASWEKLNNTSQAEECLKMINKALEEGLIEIKIGND